MTTTITTKSTPKPAEQRPVKSSASPRIPLQRRARTNTRRHFLRSLMRAIVLITSDILVVLSVLYLLQTPPEYFTWLKDAYATVTIIIPPGLLGIGQIALAFVLSLAIAGNYGPGDRRKKTSRLLLGCLIASALVCWHTLWLPGKLHILSAFLLLTSMLWVGLVIERQLLDRVVRFAKVRRDPEGIAILVGTPDECMKTKINKDAFDEVDLKIIGFVDCKNEPDPAALGYLGDLPFILDSYRVDTVILCSQLSDEDYLAVLDASFAARCHILATTNRLRVPGVRPAILSQNGSLILRLTSVTLDAWQLIVKRAIDLVGATLGLVILSPVLLLISLAIKLDSKGPILFKQIRIGLAGRSFMIRKFRSMVYDAEKQLQEVNGKSIYKDGRLFKIPDDPRVTKVGKLLRKSSLDELPQLINVIRGEMSLVGPRPPLPGEVAAYEEHHYCRFDVKPGMTGPWQISGRNRITDFEEVIRMETDYIRNWSIVLDFKILLKTIPVVLWRTGAY